MSQSAFDRSLEVSRVFTPTSPVDERALFAGRHDQLRQVIDAVNQKGQHAIIFGERGVGKTSLSNVLSAFLPAVGTRATITPRINCDSSDTYESVIYKAFNEMQLFQQRRGVGFATPADIQQVSGTQFLQGGVSPDNVRRALSLLSANFVPILILDEFDRLPEQAKHGIADTIKSLSDHGVDATIIIAGVADTVSELIKEHASIERAMVQIPMPRMSSTEIIEILTNGCERLQLTIETPAAYSIQLLSQGLPHYAHLLGLYSARLAIEDGTNIVTIPHVRSAIEKALSNSHQSIQTAYHTATMSPRKDNLFADVLLSCALSQVDQLGYFAAQDVRVPMQKITGKNYEIPSFSQHLKEFTDPKRGPVLQKIGTPRRFRFRFINPLLQPFVVMQGCQSGKLDLDAAIDMVKPSK